MMTALKIFTAYSILLGSYLGKRLVNIGMHMFLENCLCSLEILLNILDNTLTVTKPETNLWGCRFLLQAILRCCEAVFLNWDSLHARLKQPLRGMELQEKEAQKDSRIQKICLEKTYSQKMSFNSRIKATKIIDQKKAFYRQRIS